MLKALSIFYGLLFLVLIVLVIQIGILFWQEQKTEYVSASIPIPEELYYRADTAVLTYTVDSMSWQSMVLLERSFHRDGVESGWTVPEGARILSSELQVLHGTNPEWKPWFTYETQVEYIEERVILRSGIGRVADPYYPEYELRPGEQYVGRLIMGRINLVSSTGELKTLLVPTLKWGQYTDYEVGMQVAFPVKRHPIQVPQFEQQLVFAK